MSVTPLGVVPAKVQRVPSSRTVPPGFFSFHFFIFVKFKLWARANAPKGRLLPAETDSVASGRAGGRARRATEKKQNEKTTLGGGSLGSCVDEERSQLRELM